MKAMQRVGDRDKTCWSVKDIAFTITANAQSKVQLIVDYETADNPDRDDMEE
jgi:hypothetical protein